MASPGLAIRDCTAIIASGKELPDSLPYAYLDRGNAYATCHKADLAVEDFNAALKYPLQLAHAHFGLGQIYKARQDWPHAAEEFGKAAASRSEDADNDTFTADSVGGFRADSLSERGFALFKNGNLKQPLADYAAASQLCPTCSAPVRNKGLLLETEGKYSEAAAADDQAIALDMRSSPAFLIRGVLDAHMSKYAQAVADYTEAIRLYPDYDLPYKARAFAYAKLGKSKEAAQDRKRIALLQKELQGKLQLQCDSATRPKATASTRSDQVGAAALNDAALTALFSAKAWEAKQGPWLAQIEFRGDGSYRQKSKDQTPGSKLEVTMDGAWGVAKGQLCIYTNVALCLTGHVAGDNVSLTRADSGTLEYFGQVSKLQSLSADMATAPVAEFPLEEVLLPGAPAPTKGGKTLLYYIHGFEERARAHSPVTPYFVSQIQKSKGWDVIDADYPRALDSQVERYEASNFGAAAYVARRIKELKSQGYDRIIVGGQSWGGWTSLVLATQRNLPLDGVILEVPAFAWGFGGANLVDQDFTLNKLYFDQRIKRVLYPTVAIFFDGDQFEPADRGVGAIEALTQNGIPNLIIDHPLGFRGHGAAWFPVFDYEYRGCIVAFLEAPKTTQCARRPISGNDFRTELTAAQLGDWQTRTMTLPDLMGRTFAVYPDGQLQTIVSADKTQVQSYGLGRSEEASSFHDGNYCIHPNVKYLQPASTDESCATLVKWSDHEMLALDRQSGSVVQWWVEQKP